MALRKKINIIDLSNKNNNRKKKIHPDLAEPPFFMAFIGPSRSGKSNCVRNLLLRPDLYKNVFEYIFIFCPSIDLNGDFDELNTTTKTEVKKINHFNENMISEIMKQQKDIIKQHGKNKAPHVLLLLDDVFDDDKFTRSRVLKTLACRGRHMLISVIVSGQKLSLMGTACRNNLTHMVMFRPGNYSELDFWVEENVEKRKRKEFSEKFKKIWAEKYKFIFVDYLNPDLTKRFRKGFSEPIDIEL